MRLGVDFGTSNTAAAVMVGGKPWVIPLGGGHPTLPTALFFDPYRKQTLIGHAAVDALIDGREGRFMRALKSVLGTSLMHESRLIGGERLTLIEVVARFIAQIKTDAEAQCRQPFDRVLSGRPVRFHSTDMARNARALIDLEQAYRLAGFAEVDFLPEPEAAAYSSGGVGNGLGLIVDIGGGTSDFTLFRGEPGAIEILSSHGVRIGGTDFDRVLNLTHVMPRLGLGTDIRNEFGSGRHTAPQALFHDLATWEKIAFLYSGETRRAVARMAKSAVDQPAFARLTTVLEMELGHEIAFAVEKGKIGVNTTPQDGSTIDLRMIESGLRLPLTTDQLSSTLQDLTQGIRAAAAHTLDAGGVQPDAVTKVVLVGGSSLMAVVEAAVSDLCPKAELARGDAFTAVVNGLAIAAAA